MEMVVTVGLVAVGFAAFALATKHLPIFPAHGGHDSARDRGH
jgi:Ni/Fe-hydrogenase subunit HybB-like protein